MSEALQLASEFPEQNPRNFEWDAAVRLNDWGIAAAEMLKAQAAEIASLRAERDALKAGSERYWWLLNYLVSDSTKHDDAIVEAKTSDELDAVISAAKEQG